MPAFEDAIDFACSPVWVRHYAAQGLTTGYTAEMDYRPPEPVPPAVPDPCRSIQQYRRFYHLDLPMDKDAMRHELRQVTRLEDADQWFAERMHVLQRAIAGNAPPPELPPRVERPRGKGVEI